jgi:hypothetical protein
MQCQYREAEKIEKMEEYDLAINMYEKNRMFDNMVR